MRAAQKAGDYRSLYPRGAERVEDVPWYLNVAIEHGLTILNWFENLPDDERPPEHIWEDAEGLELWWETVKAKREDGMPTNRGLDDHAQDDQSPHLTENEYARFLKNG